MKHSFISAGNIWVQSCSVLSSQLLWVSHRWQLSPTQLAHSPAVGGAENGRVKVWQLVGWGPEFNKVNIGHTSKAKQEFNYHSPWAGRCSAFPSPGKQDPITSVAFEDKQHLSECCPFHLLSLNIFITEHDTIRYVMSLWPAGVSCSTCVPSHLLLHPQPPHSMRSSKGLAAG